MKDISFEALRGLRRPQGGLSPAEVDTQRSRYGVNDIVEVAGHPWLELLADTLKDPMIWFLVGTGTVFLITGELSDAVTLFVAVLPLLLMDAFLHWRTQASTATLRGQLSAVVTVLREAKELEIDSREVVPGDLIVLKPGWRVPADGVFEIATDIQIDESVLTGESFPVAKKALSADPFTLAALPEAKVPADVLGYAGTRVLTGQGRLRVLFTGARTSYGEIVQSVVRMPHERTPLQKSLGRLVQFLVLAAGAFCLLLAGVRIYQGHGWLDALLSAATLAVAAIPEEFPVVFTFFLGVGIYRLAKKRALVRKAVSVENIGRITQICTDKTGTITVGNLKLTHMDAADGVTEESLLRAAATASGSDSDPVDIAIREAADKKNPARPVVLQTMPFTEDRKRETGITAAGGKALICVKGAPELILALSDLASDERAAWRKRISAWAKEGHKVLGCAQVTAPLAATYQEPESGFRFLGLLAFEDPARPEVAEAMAYCRANGIRVLMITGDHPDTAAAIARDSGLAPDTVHVVSAEENPEKFEERWLADNPNFLKGLNVVARCTPLQKLRVVTALRKAGELVAVTGDGVNDVPALKAADIGIAMGERGTRSAKEVSSIILGDDNFRTIVNAIQEGRQLFRNLRMSFEYLLLIHIPLVAAAALVPLAGFPLVFLPVHIVWLELVIHPTALLSFQSPSGGGREAGRNEQSFFSAAEVSRICFVGLGVAAALAWSFLSGGGEGSDPAVARARAMALLTLWSAGLGALLTGFRSGTARILAAATALSSVLLIRFSASLPFLKLSPLSVRDWAEVSALVVVSLGAAWVLKRASLSCS